MKIYIDMDINMPEEEKPEDEEVEWPVKPFEEEKRRVQILELNLYDGATIPDESQDDGYVEADLWTLNTTQKSSDTASASPFSYAWYGNEREIVANDIEDFFDQDEAGDRDIWNHKPLRFIEKDEIEANSDVLPVGVEYPDMEIALVTDNGSEIDAVSYEPFLGGTCDGEIKKNSDENLQYRWNPSPVMSSHLRVTEKTSCSRMTNIQIYFEPNQAGADVEYSDFYGLFWCPFDTSDKNNYKMTEEPRYDALENAEPPIELFGTTQYDLFLFPRLWGFWIEFLNGTTFKRAFLWSRASRDFRMPKGRKTGKWEACCPHTNAWFIELDFDEFYPEYTLNENNRHVILEYQGDAKYRNCFFLHNANDFDYRGAYPWYLENPGTLCCNDDGDVPGKPFWWAFEYDSDLSDYHRPYIPNYRFSIESLSWDKRTSWWDFTCPSDGKVIQMKNQATLGPGDADLHCDDELDDTYYANDTYYYHNVADYDSDEIAKVTALKEFILEHPQIKEVWGLTAATIRAWGIFMGAGIEGDLVGILRRGTVARYVWRKTDETIYYEGGEHTLDPYSEYEGVRAMAFTEIQFDPGNQIEVNLHGDLQMTWTAKDINENTVVGRKLKNDKWGNYYSYNPANEASAVTSYLNKFDTGGEAHLFLYFQDFDKYL